MSGDTDNIQAQRDLAYRLLQELAADAKALGSLADMLSDPPVIMADRGVP